MAANDIERLIRARIPDAEVTSRDLAGDGDHYAATVIAESFRGKSRVQQHQIVYAALRGEMGGKLHALALQTGAPEGGREDRFQIGGPRMLVFPHACPTRRAKLVNPRAGQDIAHGLCTSPAQP